jgi:hypothetical protein
MLSDKDTAILLAEAAKNHKHPAPGIATNYSARNSKDTSLSARVVSTKIFEIG